MTATRDSIQTLLQQRRELRECLSELREEITQLKNKADAMPEGKSDRAEGEEAAPVEAASPVEAAAPATETAVEVKKDTVFDTVNGPASLPLLYVPVGVEGEGEAPEFIKRTLQTAAPVLQTAVPSAPPSPEPEPEPPLVLTAPEKPILGRARKKLYEEAVLLTRFFLHQPAPAADQGVDRLEVALEQYDRAATVAAEETAYQNLKSAYRDLLAATYPSYGVSGKSISESEGRITSLYMLPSVIALLLLLLQPGLFLLRYYLPGLGEAALYQDGASYLGFLVSFVWGLCGGLFYQTLRLVGAVHARRFARCQFRGSAVIGSISGILGVMVGPVVDVIGVPVGVPADMAIGGMAFGLGFLWAGFYEWLSKSPAKGGADPGKLQS